MIGNAFRGFHVLRISCTISAALLATSGDALANKTGIESSRIVGYSLSRKSGSMCPPAENPWKYKCDRQINLVDSDSRKKSRTYISILYAYRPGYTDGFCPTDRCYFSVGSDIKKVIDPDGIGVRKYSNPVQVFFLITATNQSVIATLSNGKIDIYCYVVESRFNRNFISDIRECENFSNYDEVISESNRR